MTPICVYDVRRPPSTKVHYALYIDAIRVIGSSQSGDVDARVPLARLDPSFDRIWRFGFLFHVGHCVFMLGILLFLIIAVVSQAIDDRRIPVRPLAATGAFAAAGLAMCLIHRRKLEHINFRSDSGVTILTVLRGTSNAGEFDEFVLLLVKQIRLAKAGPTAWGSPTDWTGLGDGG